MFANRRRQQKTFLSIYMFLVIFAPPIMPKFRIVMAIITITYILGSRQGKKKLSKYIFNSSLSIFIIGIIFFLMHMFMMLLINELIFQDTVQFSHYTGLYNRFIVPLMVIIPCSLFLIIKMDQYKLEIEDFWTIIFGAELIETASVMLALVSPTVKSWFNHLALIMNGGALRENTWYITVRSYGFSESLLDSFGFGAGLIAGLAFIYGVMKNRKYLFLSFIMLIASLVNARTGVIIYLIAVIMILAYQLVSGNLKKIMSIISGIIIFSIVGVLLWDVLVEYYPATTGWIEEGLGDLSKILTGYKNDKNVTGFVSVVQTESWWELPEFPRYILGTGHSRYQAEGYTHTDFGYVNDIWAGGIIGCIVLYGSIIWFTLKSYRKMDKCYQIIMMYMVVALLAFNVKASAYTCNTGLVAYVIIVSYINYYCQFRKKISEKIQFIYIQNAMKKL